MPKVIVTDASERAALAVIRSLGKKGIEVTAADSTGFNAGFLSKYCSKKFIYPSPIEKKSKFIDSMLHLVRNENFDLLIPITDFTMIPILENRDEFENHVRVAAPPWKIAIKAFDKAQTIKIAEKLGIPCPRTFLVENLDAVKEIADGLQYPAIIKPRMKVIWVEEKAIMLKVTPRNYAYNREDLIARYLKITSQLSKYNIQSDLFLIQEFAKGEGYGVEVLMDGLSPKAVFMHKRLREYPITGGASTLRVSVWNKNLADYAVNLLREMGWQGVAMVEFKFNEKNGDASLMEVNGRFWGSLALAINAGVDFPYLLYKVMVEGEEHPITIINYKLGFIQRWLIPGDFLWLFDSLLENQECIHYSKVKILKQFLAFSPLPDDIISLEDFLPTIGTLTDAIHYFLEVIRGKRTIYGEVRFKKPDLNTLLF
ncbi:ATP-grasp domain-containing protein [Candidatus Bathyarchaeota archaeon]|nr:ATP-grasp domain-containing protein [Candidatus Bathyarchaeota archaeon]